MFTTAVVFAQNENPNFDKALADSLGADEYGMKSYVLAILKAGSNESKDENFLNTVFRGHMENIGRLSAQGMLSLAGPFGANNKNYRGIYIFNVKTIQEAEELIKTDPAIEQKVLEAELYEWYGSAAIATHLDTHKRIATTNP
jgi:uncharacterized protein YciI